MKMAHSTCGIFTADTESGLSAQGSHLAFLEVVRQWIGLPVGIDGNRDGNVGSAPADEPTTEQQQASKKTRPSNPTT